MPHSEVTAPIPCFGLASFILTTYSLQVLPEQILASFCLFCLTLLQFVYFFNHSVVFHTVILFLLYDIAM